MTAQLGTPPRALTEAVRPERTRRRRTENLRGWIYCAPFALAFILFLVWPTIYGLWMSFTGRSLTGANSSWLGVENYVEAFADPEVWSSLGNTVWFTVLSTIPLVLIALGIAVLVNLGIPGQWFWRLSFFLPFLLASTVVSLFWKWLFNPQLGLINDMLGNFGIPPVAWLNDPNTAMHAVVITTVWWTIGFNFLLYLAALQNIPDQLYEAASLDGAGSWRKFVSITLPQLAPTTVLVGVLQILASLKVFDQIYQMTGGGPAGATRPILQYVYEVGFTGYRLGYASAISYIFFFLIIAVSIVYSVIAARRTVK
ncbi:binding-protein-dependent transport systems inner membrane component [Beutenbergia cavernae DSM 12333]|uniref:Binding-protein-dependent transport systems inner membrane component n=1 Tax=Beutenbergia cavernae (strain ATCC BAA-8 / DSM 12333 / CCUG 43141 / JCM 11478 / NBRC 16432 / NCIMB 13614 / HKI 0122) TaxID=471853 RepID=C5BUQ8_BEUC1|nr:sugar ABC transporter permease [Beutenbergia cavernae]ACQ78282.1 binding-protein-dependent transport systems inner membrane component [Beutenbergia cavernae DSM 12333]